jgi:hypothetical protein
MNHASGAVAPPDAEVVQVGDAIWQRGAAWFRVRCGRWVLYKSSYSRRTVIRWRWFQIKVRSSSSRRQLPAQRSMIEFISWRLNSGADDPDASGMEDGAGRGGEAGVPVMQDEFHPVACQNSYRASDLSF